MPQQERNRRDHILPQGYLDGFTGANGLLQVFKIKEQRWFPAKTENVAWIRGFYDYSEGVSPEQTADEAFEEYEGKFPALRRELISSNFVNWKSHLDFLLRYINMFRVRSELFRLHVLQSLEDTPPMVVGEVLERKTSPTVPGTEMLKISVKPFEKTGEELKTSYNNLSISKMRADMLEVPEFFFDFHWCLRYTTDPNKPVITADTATFGDSTLSTPLQNRSSPVMGQDAVYVALTEEHYMFLLEPSLQARPSDSHTPRHDAVVGHLDALEDDPSGYEEITHRGTGKM